MKTLAVWLLLGFTAVIIYVFGLVPLGYWTVHLPVLAVLGASLRLPPQPGATVAIWTGLWLDSLSAAPFGLYLAGLLAVWLWTGLLRYWGVSFDNALSRLGLLAGGLLGLNLVLLLPLTISGSLPQFGLLPILIGQLVTTWLFAMVLPRPLQLKP